MNLTDDVIRDLLPLVREGEASADTRALVEAYLATHPGLAEESRRAEAWTLPGVAPVGDDERRALRRTKQLLARRSWSLALALFFTGLPLSFWVGDAEIHFFILAGHPWFGAASLGLGLALWGVFVRASRALKPTGF
jgi:hypothetical protein